MPREPQRDTPPSASTGALPPPVFEARSSRRAVAQQPAARQPTSRQPAARWEAALTADVEFFTADDSELLVTGEAVSLDRRAAGFVLRAAGAAIDVTAMAVLAIGASLLLSTEYFARLVGESFFPAIVISLIVLLTVALPTAIETLSHGKSLGKLAVGVRVVRDDGGSIGFRHAFIRALVGVLEIFGTAGGLAALVALLNPRARRIGDILSGCYARHERVPARSIPIVEVPASLRVWAETADVARLPDRLARRIAAFLAQSAAMLPADRHRLAFNLAAETVPFVGELPIGVLMAAATQTGEQPDAPDSVTHTAPGATTPPFAEENFLRAVAALRRERDSRSLRLAQSRLDRLEPALRALPHGFPDRG